MRSSRMYKGAMEGELRLGSIIKQMGQTKGVAGGVVVALANEDWDWESGLLDERRAEEFGSSA